MYEIFRPFTKQTRREVYAAFAVALTTITPTRAVVSGHVCCPIGACGLLHGLDMRGTPWSGAAARPLSGGDPLLEARLQRSALRFISQWDDFQMDEAALARALGVKVAR